ncbi:hypothetical protein [Methanosarcina acetivorans]|uniref:Uncharacterized protein n=1 Tax=Methanosarcina acetivorans (strain ATCC 35395 / DSM 2834 / JCM 12185 / C2A) TaxID=188937 RepID=Q8TLA6_METAC|nr:hypothetical protein [Methanosarcina acetivorans]AAM06505.1 predicted protein [Methanosarcina acetivorans C2A]
MTNEEGFLYIILFISFFIILAGYTTLTITYTILRQVKNKLSYGAIILAGIVLNFALLKNTNDVSWLIIETLFFAVPMVVLAPPALIPDRLKAIPSFPRILICYTIIAVLDIILPFILIITEISMIPFIYWNTPLSNGLVYICLIIGYFGIATIIYQLIGKYYRV